jgi:orotate phosphoribosyltransferase
MDNNKLITWLFKTDAVRVCPENKPFWYTSSKIGPYYINTHFLYGSEEKANNLLKVIDVCKENKMECSEVILELAYKNYESDEIFRGLITSMCEYIKENLDLEKIDYISGGERRDWFFSLIIAKILKLPHITIFKDLSAVLYNNGVSSEVKDLKNANVLHIADIITEASSYIRGWIPAIDNLGASMKYTWTIIDRKQGGLELLEEKGINSNALLKIDIELFDKAHQFGIISDMQFDMIGSYIADPKGSMREFLKKNPGFLEASLKADEKTASRARICIDNKLYDL